MNPIILIPLLFMALIIILMILYKIADIFVMRIPWLPPFPLVIDFATPLRSFLDNLKETIKGWVEAILNIFKAPFDWMYNTFTTLNIPPEIASALAIMIISGLTIGAVYLTYEAIKVLST